MKFTIHIQYKDGSNPFLSLGGWDKIKTKEEVTFQLQHNANRISSIHIWPYGLTDTPKIVWMNPFLSCSRYVIFKNDKALTGGYASLGAVLNKLERMMEYD